ncbi:MAG: CPBP family intramembrane metalloprotease [Verrucomicrobiota bacterium JB022]|nr:CPBP family intramembrane metalloprotease [Verrucomicrobiota bacterium JB022]
MDELAGFALEDLIPLIAYLGLVLTIGLMVTFWGTMQLKADPDLLKPRLPAWRANPVEAGIFGCAIIGGYIGALSFVGSLEPSITALWPDTPNIMEILGTVTMEVFLTLIVIGLYRYFGQDGNRDRINPQPQPLPRNLMIGGLALLGVFPILFGINIVWGFLLQVLNELGLGFDIEAQPAVSLLQNMESPGLLALMLFAVVVMAPVSEELVFRAGVYRLCKNKLPVSASVIVSSLLFAAVHFHWQSMPGLFLVGACLALIYEYTGDVRANMAFHAAFNLNSVIMIFLVPPGSI